MGKNDTLFNKEEPQKPYPIPWHIPIIIAIYGSTPRTSVCPCPICQRTIESEPQCSKPKLTKSRSISKRSLAEMSQCLKHRNCSVDFRYHNKTESLPLFKVHLCLNVRQTKKLLSVIDVSVALSLSLLDLQARVTYVNQNVTTVFLDTRLSKTKYPRKRFQNFHQSYMLSTDRIEIHQSQSA